MEVALNKGIIVFNQGFIQTTRGLGKPNIKYKDTYSEYVKSYRHADTLYVNTTKSETEFSVNLNGMITCTIKVTNGYIGAKAVAIQKSKLLTKFGAIELKLRKQDIGHLYLKVDAGIILDNSHSVAIRPFGFTGFEGIFNGDLSDQKTEVIVKAGAIVCNIY